jgi:protein-S-isoprenylcysteine O-methyltransferase Ste14
VLLSAKLSVGLVEAEVKPSVACVLKHYAASAAIYGLLLFVLALNPWFGGLLSTSVAGVTAFKVYCWLYVAYLTLALPIYLILRPVALASSKNLLILGVCRRVFRIARGRFRRLPTPPLALSEKERYALVFLGVKLFFGPLMLSSAFTDLTTCSHLLSGLSVTDNVTWLDWASLALGKLRSLQRLELVGRLDWGYIMLVHVIFLADSCLFFVGYHTEAGFLRNNIRQVETNFWRILVCIVCYPPFNQVSSSVFGRSLNDPYIIVSGNFRGVWTWSLRAVAVFSLLLLISASGSLFTKASNLTNRGIVTWGPYRYIRHPGYLAKNLFWLMTLLPALVPNTASVFFSWTGFWLSSLCTVAGCICWGTIYFLRAITEEQFLSRDPEYVAYSKRVKWRFIPGVY